MDAVEHNDEHLGPLRFAASWSISPSSHHQPTESIESRSLGRPGCGQGSHASNRACCKCLPTCGRRWEDDWKATVRWMYFNDS